MDIIFVVIPFALVVITVVTIFVIRKVQFSKLPPDVRAGIQLARDARAEYRRVRTNYEDGVSSARAELHALEDLKGRWLKSAGGVTLYERWIDTPQGHGSLIGVRAKSENDPYDLAAYSASPRQANAGQAYESSTEKAYVVIEGPDVSGVAVFPATAGVSPMQHALNFSAEVNNAAHAAERAAPLMRARIEAARQQLEAANKDDAMVKRAGQAYAEAVARLPIQNRGQFRDASSLAK